MTNIERDANLGSLSLLDDFSVVFSVTEEMQAMNEEGRFKVLPAFLDWVEDGMVELLEMRSAIDFGDSSSVTKEVNARTQAHFTSITWGYHTYVSADQEVAGKHTHFSFSVEPRASASNYEYFEFISRSQGLEKRLHVEKNEGKVNLNYTRTEIKTFGFSQCVSRE